MRIQNFLIFNFLILILTFTFLFLTSPVYAIVDPLASPNNRFGIHIITASDEEASQSATLVNSSGGDWGYITVLVESKNRDHNLWQNFFNNLRQRHLIPIVRLATQPEGNNWKLPYDGEEQAWADFLDSLIWPTKNRYVVIYNEPNQGHEWGGFVDPKSYAQTLDKTITALKNKNPDFFVLNAGFDASAPNSPPNFEDEVIFLKQMNDAVPGIFNRLDGWVSHSYPNPNFAGSPDATGRGTVGTYFWELGTLKSIGLNKNLPVFITETGWKHAEGIKYDSSLPTAQTVSTYFDKAFSAIWNNNLIVAVTPFLLNYQESPFDHFSFRQLTGEGQNEKILGIQYPPYYPEYQSIVNIAKNPGQPVQDSKAKLTKGQVYQSIVSGQSYNITLTFQNTGESVWNEYSSISLVAISGAQTLGIQPVVLPADQRIQPGDQASFVVHLQAPLAGTYHVSLQLYAGDKPFDSNPIDFDTTVKSPVVLAVSALLNWKKDPSGQYTLDISSNDYQNSIPVKLDVAGNSNLIDARFLLPDQNFKFTLRKDYYKPKSINLTVKSDINQLKFGTLEPDILPALLHPLQLWKLLPFSR